jgi:hypothetical protein
LHLLDTSQFCGCDSPNLDFNVKEPLNKSWSSRQVPEIAKYEAQNAGNIANISKFCALKIAQRQSEKVPLGCNEVVGYLRELNADHGLIQRFLKYTFNTPIASINGFGR